MAAAATNAADRAHHQSRQRLAGPERDRIPRPAADRVDRRALARLIDHLLVPLEKEWNGDAKPDDTVVGSVKKLRAAVLPDMIQGEITADERDRRWRQLADMYLAQQLSCYPPDYLSESPSPERRCSKRWSASRRT